MSNHPTRRLLPAALTVVALAVAVLALAGPARAATPAPRTPSGLPTAIESLADYAGQTSCDPVIKPGTRALAGLLVRTYPGTSYASGYNCGTDGSRSEHYEGRAIDWMVSIRNARTFADATAVIHWLLATDRHGNKFAMARRLGVMYLIYNNRMWGAWDGAWEPYNNCAKLTSRAYDTSCHRDHMHISLSWNGAFGRTTFWTKQVFATDYGPCRARDLNWAEHKWTINHTSCRDYPKVAPPAHASALKVALVKYSGAGYARGFGGPGVVAVQQALHVTASGVFGTATTNAVNAFQRRHHLRATGRVNAPTWRLLLASVH